MVPELTAIALEIVKVQLSKDFTYIPFAIVCIAGFLKLPQAQFWSEVMRQIATQCGMVCYERGELLKKIHSSSLCELSCLQLAESVKQILHGKLVCTNPERKLQTGAIQSSADAFKVLKHPFTVFAKD